MAYPLSKNQRILFFFFGCVIARFIPFCMIRMYPYTKKTLAMIYLLFGIGFLYTFFFSTSKTGFFGGPVWWGNLRIIHAFLYLSFVLFTWCYPVKDSEYIILLDTLIGISAFVYQYYIK